MANAAAAASLPSSSSYYYVCPIDTRINVFHESSGGCGFTLREDSFGGVSLMHEFHATMVSLDTDGRPLVHTSMRLGNDVRIKYHSANSLSARVSAGPFDCPPPSSTAAEATTTTIDDNNELLLPNHQPTTTPLDIMSIDRLLTVDNFTQVLHRLYVNFFDTCVRRGPERTIYYMRPKHFLDIYCNDSLLANDDLNDAANAPSTSYRFRPVLFTESLSQVLAEWSDCFIHALRMCAHNTTITTTSSSSQPTPRNSKSCRVRSFLRRPPPHLQCGYYVRRRKRRNGDDPTTTTNNDDESMCVHMVSLDDGNPDTIARELRKIAEGRGNADNICVRVLRAFVAKHSEQEFSQLFGFKCMLLSSSSTDSSSSSSLVNVVNRLYGRYDSLHGILCCPRSLLATRAASASFLELLDTERMQQRLIKKKRKLGD